jgi:hypothetical protein
MDLFAIYSKFLSQCEDVEHPCEVWVDACPDERTVDQAVASGGRIGRFRSLSVSVDDIGQYDAADWPIGMIGSSPMVSQDGLGSLL